MELWAGYVSCKPDVGANHASVSCASRGGENYKLTIVSHALVDTSQVSALCVRDRNRLKRAPAAFTYGLSQEVCTVLTV
jgi:hypothetical protein